MNAAALPSTGKNRKVAMLAGGLALAMLALGWASVPLYRMFCQATGWGGTTQRATEAQAASVKAVADTISVRFDANVDANVPWQFAPEKVSQVTHLGSRTMAVFRAKNMSDHAITGEASFNVSPDEAGKYFTKIQCFCFTEQTLQPGQEVRMPVIYYVDPSIAQDGDAKQVQQITLSYTFHLRSPAAAAVGAKPVERVAIAR
jgi:cytochrome c oxidase assembly protein subunit 11